MDPLTALPAKENIRQTIYYYLSLSHIQATRSLIQHVTRIRLKREHCWIFPQRTQMSSLLLCEKGLAVTAARAPCQYLNEGRGSLPSVLFMSPAEQREHYTAKCVLRKFSKGTAAQLHLLDAVCCYLVRLSIFCEVSWTLWASFILVICWLLPASIFGSTVWTWRECWRKHSHGNLHDKWVM